MSAGEKCYGLALGHLLSGSLSALSALMLGLERGIGEADINLINLMLVTFADVDSM